MTKIDSNVRCAKSFSGCLGNFTSAVFLFLFHIHKMSTAKTYISSKMVHECLKKKAPANVSPMAAGALANAMDQIVALIAEDAAKQMKDTSLLQTKHIKAALCNLECTYPDIVAVVDGMDATFKKAGSIVTLVQTKKTKKAKGNVAEAGEAADGEAAAVPKKHKKSKKSKKAKKAKKSKAGKAGKKAW